MYRNIHRRPYEGMEPDGDGQFYAYSGEEFGVDTGLNRNYGKPLWGDCDDDVGSSLIFGVLTDCGPVSFSEMVTATAGCIFSLDMDG